MLIIIILGNMIIHYLDIASCKYISPPPLVHHGMMERQNGLALLRATPVQPQSWIHSGIPGNSSTLHIDGNHHTFCTRLRD